MERLRRLAKKSLRPKELDVVKEVFDLVTHEPWFDSCQACLDAFAARLIHMARCGITDRAHLETIAVLWATADFSRGVTAIQRQKFMTDYEMRINLRQ